MTEAEETAQQEPKLYFLQNKQLKSTAIGLFPNKSDRRTSVPSGARIKARRDVRVLDGGDFWCRGRLPPL